MYYGGKGKNEFYLTVNKGLLLHDRQTNGPSKLYTGCSKTNSLYFQPRK